jgi:hypothetical protein
MEGGRHGLKLQSIWTEAMSRAAGDTDDEVERRKGERREETEWGR